MNSIGVEVFKAEALHEHLSVGSSVYSSLEVLNPEHFLWKHLNGPYGPSTGICFRNHETKLVGRSMIQSRDFISGSSIRYKGGIITDFVISPEARSPKVVIEMTKKIKDLSGYEVVAHTSNENSELIYRSLFKFPVLFSLKAYGLPINISNLVKAKIGSFWITTYISRLLDLFLKGIFLACSQIFSRLAGLGFGSPPPSNDIDRILEQFRGHVGSHYERSSQCMDWRFNSAPLFKGLIKWIWSKNECLGYVALRQVTLNNVSFLVLMDPVFSRRLSSVEAVALKFLCVSEGYSIGSDVIFTMINESNSVLKMIRGFPFISIHDKYLPHPTPIYIHRSNNILNDDLSTTFFTLADLDYF